MKIKIFLWLLLSGLLSAQTTHSGTTIGGTTQEGGFLSGLTTCKYPGSTCTFNASPSGVARPAVGVVYADPDYKTRIIRITPQISADAFGHTPPNGYFHENDYPPHSPWNSNGTYILLMQSDGYYSLYADNGGQSYTFFRELNSTQICSAGIDISPVWSTTDPDKFYYICGNIIYRYSVSAATQSNGGYATNPGNVAQFTLSTTYVPAGHTAKLQDYANPSANSCRWGFIVYVTATGLFDRVLVVDICQAVVLANKTVGTTGSDFVVVGSGNVTCPCNKTPADVSMSASGNYAILEWNTDSGVSAAHNSVEIYTADLNTLVARIPASAAASQVIHSDNGLDGNGDEIYVSQIQTGSGSTANNFRRIEAYRLKDGVLENSCQLSTNSTPDFYNSSPLNDWHVSMRASITGAMKGWVLVSSHTTPGNGSLGGTNVNPDNGSTNTLNEEVFYCKLDGTNEVRRIAHDQTVRNDFFAETHASPSQDGKKILFNSTWRTNIGGFPYTAGCTATANDCVSAYVVELK
jgi:hypothetical protein